MIIRDNYTVINTREELQRAVELGLKVYLSDKSNRPDFGYIEPLHDVTRYFPGALGDFDMFHWRAVGEHDLSPAKPEPPTNADINPGDIVRYRGKKWRVQGIDDGDPDGGLLLLDVAEPEDAPDFVNTSFPVTRGTGRRPNGPGGRRWRWARAGKAELVSRGEPEAPDSDPANGFGVIDVPASFHISVTIHADTPEGYTAAIETLARGIES